MRVMANQRVFFRDKSRCSPTAQSPPMSLTLRCWHLAMKILLRNLQTGLFYAGPNQWTQNDPEAFDFEQTDLALDAVRDAKLTGIEVLVKFEDPAFEIPLSIVNAAPA